MWTLKAVVALCGVCSVLGAALNDNIDIDIKVDTDSKLYHQGKTVEGSFNYGYNVPRRNYNQYQHKVKGPDGVTYGCYGFVDPTNGTHLYHYVSDLKGYRVVPPNQPTKVFTERVANSVANIYDSVGETYDWEKLYFPDVCRVLQKSKEERNELSIPKGFQVNDDGSVTQTTQKPKASEPPSRRTTAPSPAPTKPPTTRAAPTTTSRPATPRPSQPRTTSRAATARASTRRVTAASTTTPKPTTPRPTTAAPRIIPSTTAKPTTTRRPTTVPPRPTNAPRAQRPPTTQAPVVPVQTTQARTSPKNNILASTAKPSGNKFGTNRDNFIGAPATNTAETLKPPQDLEAVGQDISELKQLLQMLLKSLNNNSPKTAPADCDDSNGLGAVNPNAKQVFLPLVIVDTLPGAKGASQTGVPAGSQFAIPSIGYGTSRCNTCG
uniref:Uncharacterized protein n=1 Tax=Anopheles farauti TaxID=69004 RepID=A0A182QUB1_9DIPT